MDKKFISNLTIEELETTVAEVVEASFKKNRTDFYIEPELHYNHHQDIGEFFKGLSNIKSWITKAVVTTITIAVLGVIVAGVVVKLKG